MAVGGDKEGGVGEEEGGDEEGGDVEEGGKEGVAARRRRLAYPPRAAWGVLPYPMAPTCPQNNTHNNQSTRRRVWRFCRL